MIPFMLFLLCRLNGGEWIEYKGILSAGKLVKLAQGQTMDGNEHEETTNELVIDKRWRHKLYSVIALF